jgi:hypothetical protein
VRSSGRELLRRLHLPPQPHELVPRDALPQPGELLGLLVVRVVTQLLDHLPHQRVEPGLARVHRLELLHRPLELLVLLDVVLDRLVTVGHVLAHRGVHVHLLGDRVPDDLGDHGVRQVPPLVGIDAVGEAIQQRERFSVITGQLVDDVSFAVLPVGVRLGHVGLLVVGRRL